MTAARRQAPVEITDAAPSKSVEVGDLEAAVDAVAAEGYGLIGGIGEYEKSVRMADARGPEGIIVSLFERIG